VRVPDLDVGSAKAAGLGAELLLKNEMSPRTLSALPNAATVPNVVSAVRAG
jgi:hypothetical protein